MGLSNTEMVPVMLAVAVPGEADPKVVIFGVVEVHLSRVGTILLQKCGSY